MTEEREAGGTGETEQTGSEAGNQTRTRNASRALSGYVYQREVSVWLALHLIVEKGLCERLEIEPADEEDALAQVESSAEGTLPLPDARQLGARAETDRFPFSIQIKSKSTGPWRVAAVNDVLTHGTDRQPAVDALFHDPSRRYVLITDAALQDTAQALGVGRPLEVVTDLPATTRKLTTQWTDPKRRVDLSGRVGVLHSLKPEILHSRIGTILSEYLRVPFPRLEACHDALSKSVFTLMETDGGFLTRNAIEQTAKDHGGLVGPFSTSSIFVKPGTYGAMLEALERDHALLIAGPSGTGKTTVARRLVDDLQAASETAYEICTVRHPSEIPPNAPDRPRIIYIDDPFGDYALSTAAPAWKKRLPDILKGASPSQRFIVTTRTDIMNAAGAARLEPFTLWLQAETYDASARNDLYDAWMKTLPEAMERLAERHRKRFMADLDTPLEFKKFFRALQEDVPGDLSDWSFARRSLKRARDEAIEDRLVETIRERKMEIAAAVAWGLLEAFPVLSVFDVDEVMSRINAIETPNLPAFSAALRDEIDPVFADLVAKYSLKKIGSDYTYQHNRDEKGLRLSFAEKSAEASEVLSRVVAAMLSDDEKTIQRGGAALAVRMMKDADRLARAAAPIRAYRTYPTTEQRKEAAREDRELGRRAARKALQLHLTDPIQARLDAVLLDALLETDRKEAKSAFDNLALAGSDRSAQARLARWLVARGGEPDGDGDEEIFRFTMMAPCVNTQDSPQFEDDMRAADHTPDLLRAYVELVMPNGGFQMLGDMIDPLYRLDPDIGQTFRKTLIEHVDRLGSIDASSIARGAFHRPEQCDDVAAALQGELEALYGLIKVDDEEGWARLNDVMPDDEQEWGSYGYYEDIHNVERVLSNYVQAMRGRDWTRLKTTLSTAHALETWLEEASKSGAAADELRYIYTVLCNDGSEAAFWATIRPTKTCLKDEAFQVVCDAPAPGMVIDAIHHIKTSGGRIDEANVIALRAARGSAGVLQTAVAWAYAPPADLSTAGLSGFALSALTLEENQIFEAIVPLADPLPQNIGPKNAPLETLKKYRLPESREYDLAVLAAIGTAGGDISDDIRTILSADRSPNYDDIEYLVSVVETACALGLADVVEEFLDHKHSVVPATLATHVLASAKTLPKSFAPLLSSRSRSLLKVLWAYLKEREASDVRQELEALLFNDAINSDRPDSDDVLVPFAMKAVKRLLQSRPDALAASFEDLLARVRETPSDHFAWNLAGLTARYASPDQTREMVEVLIREAERRPVRDALLAGLVFKAETVDLSSLDSAKILAQFQQPAADYRVLFAMLLGAHGSDAQVAAFTARRGLSDSERLLSLPLAVGRYISAADKTLGRQRAGEAMNDLDPMLRRKVLEALDNEETMPREEIRSLGSVRLRSCVYQRLGGILFKDERTDG